MSDFEDFVLLEARDVPLGGPRGMTVHRTLPARRTSLIGGWCFVDHFGPDDLTETGGMQVARHPHTGLATVSWLFEGDRKSTRLNSSHVATSYAVFCLKKKSIMNQLSSLTHTL